MPSIPNLALIDKIKKITITSLVADDRLMETLFLKGGNALSQVYDLDNRASFDIDYSIEEDFKEEIEEVKALIEASLTMGFSDAGFHLFDFTFEERPRSGTDIPFWGGYRIYFKLIEAEKYRLIGEDTERIRREAIQLTMNKSTRFKIDISKHEYVGSHKRKAEIDGVTFYVYAPELIVFEKLRAICQKLPEYYTEVLKQQGNVDPDRARARDFYDIHTLLDTWPFDYQSDESKETLRNVFKAKRVPLTYLKKIRRMKEVHRQDFESVRETMTSRDEADFDFYFEYVMERFEYLFDA